MGLRVYNTLTRRKEDLVTREPGKVGMYVCGQTPYADPHVGHAWKAVAFDVIRRHLIYRGHQVAYVENITDVEDKIIARSHAEGIPWYQVAEKYTISYLEEMAKLGVLPADHSPKASEHIEDIVRIVQGLVERGYAYPVDGDVYFSVRKFAGYGKLSGRQLDDLLAGARVEVEERKEDPLDFALWKAAKPGEPAWDSPWGEGRPGWHIECSAMSERYLGPELDIHGGGADLIFPHHENEIAQSEAYDPCTPLARYWLHCGWLTLHREKMSKSLGNVIGIEQARELAGAQALRYFFVSQHYRSDVEFSEDAVHDAARALERLRIAVGRLKRLLGLERATQGPSEAVSGLAEQVSQARTRFEEAMDDDFNTPRALAALFDLVTEINRATGAAVYQPAEQDAPVLEQALSTLIELAAVLGIDLEAREAGLEELSEKLIGLLVEVRREARNKRLWELADRIRARLGEMGIALEDHAEGTTWRRALSSQQ